MIDGEIIGRFKLMNGYTEGELVSSPHRYTSYWRCSVAGKTFVVKRHHIKHNVKTVDGLDGRVGRWTKRKRYNKSNYKVAKFIVRHDES
jgi:hypothetical protein